MPIDFGDLRRLTPIDSSFGLGRGKPVDRRYIEDFLARHRRDIRGRVLEVAEDTYTFRFGGNQVTSDILHIDDSHPGATVIADLADADHLSDATFDCFICTQTLTYIFDVPRALATIHRILRPGGVLLTTVPGISQISPYDQDRWGEFWRFTEQSLGRLLGDAFGPANVEVVSYGNVLASLAFLHGLCVDDLSPDELDYRDPRYQMLVTGRAVKPKAGIQVVSRRAIRRRGDPDRHDRRGGSTTRGCCASSSRAGTFEIRSIDWSWLRCGQRSHRGPAESGIRRPLRR